MNTEKQYIQAFNTGYLMAKYESKLLKAISQNLSPVNNYLEGLMFGVEEFELENYKCILSEIDLLRIISGSRDKSIDKDY